MSKKPVYFFYQFQFKQIDSVRRYELNKIFICYLHTHEFSSYESRYRIDLAQTNRNDLGKQQTNKQLYRRENN